jgi:hypothetical protein
MSSQDYVRYLTERFVHYVETPKEQRIKKKKEPWSYRWFGMLPVAVRLMFGRRIK